MKGLSRAAVCCVVLLLGSSAATLGAEKQGKGAELIGSQAPAWGALRWLQSEPMKLGELRGRVVLVRWWTETCPFCAASAPALRELHDTYQGRGLVVVGMYHPKPRGRRVAVASVAADLRPRHLDTAWGSDGRGVAGATGGAGADQLIAQGTHPDP